MTRSVLPTITLQAPTSGLPAFRCHCVENCYQCFHHDSCSELGGLRSSALFVACQIVFPSLSPSTFLLPCQCSPLQSYPLSLNEFHTVSLKNKLYPPPKSQRHYPPPETLSPTHFLGQLSIRFLLDLHPRHFH